MGKTKTWLGAVKRVFSPEPKEKKVDEQKTPKSSKKKWSFAKSKHACSNPASLPGACSVAPAAPPPDSEVKLTESENKQNKHVYSAALATAEAAVAAAKAAAEVVRLTANAARLPGKSREEAAALRIQTAFRGYLARRALRALRGLAKLKSLMQGDTVKRQAASTLRCMQIFTRVQSEIRSRRIRMQEENHTLQRQLQLKRERELEALRAAMGEEWDDSLQSKEQIEANIMNKHEAAVRRERALAYAFSHQWKSSSRSVNPMFTDPNNPQWGWSWLERWMAARPWEGRSPAGKHTGNEQVSMKSLGTGGEIMRAYTQRDTNSDRPSPAGKKSSRPASWRSPSTPPSKASSVVGGKMRSASPRGTRCPSEDDSRSMFSIRSERNRRHSIAGSSVRDDESLASSPAVPNYMISTESARAKSRFLSPSSDKIDSVKKRLSFPAADKYSMLSPAGARRQSGPPKFDITSATDNAAVSSEHETSNGVRR